MRMAAEHQSSANGLLIALARLKAAVVVLSERPTPDI